MRYFLPLRYPYAFSVRLRPSRVAASILPGMDFLTPSMRRAIYEMLRSDVVLIPRGTRVWSVVDANVVRMTREVEYYAARYLEVQVKGSPYDKGSFVDAWQAAVLPKPTDKVMAEVAS